MRRRFRNPAPVPSGVGSGPAAVDPLPSPVSREEEERMATIWHPVVEATYSPETAKWKFEQFGNDEVAVGVGADDGVPVARYVATVREFITPAADPTSNAPKKRGRPKGSKNKVQS